MQFQRSGPSALVSTFIMFVGLTAGATSVLAATKSPTRHHVSFDLTPYMGEHAAQCSGSGVSDPRDQQKIFIIKSGEIEIRGHNFWYSKLKYTSKGEPDSNGNVRSTAYYFVNSASDTTLVFDNGKLSSATTHDVAPDANGQAMNVETVCNFN